MSVEPRFRSGLERQVAHQLDTVGLPYTYEEERIKFLKPARTATYTPDFVITTRTGKTIIIETKGRFLTADRAKHLLIQDQHPELDIRFVFSNSATRISKISRTTYAKWCEDKGFRYADKHIPKEWLDE